MPWTQNRCCQLCHLGVGIHGVQGHRRVENNSCDIIFIWVNDHLFFTAQYFIYLAFVNSLGRKEFGSVISLLL
jgi:hypothetical protein